MKNKTYITPSVKKKIENNQMLFEWQYGNENSNLVLENSKLNVKLFRYLIVSSDDKTLYDAISINEPETNTVILVRNKNNEIGLVYEWRPIPEKWFWACPRGFGDPNDEDNIATAKREMIEEIGNCKFLDSKKIGSLYQNTTFFENPVGLVLVDVEEVETQLSEEEGIIDFKFYSKKELLEMIREDKIEDIFTLSALMRFFAIEDFK